VQFRASERGAWLRALRLGRLSLAAPRLYMAGSVWAPRWAVDGFTCPAPELAETRT
jgi:hypothetical protein